MRYASIAERLNKLEATAAELERKDYRRTLLNKFPGLSAYLAGGLHPCPHYLGQMRDYAYAEIGKRKGEGEDKDVIDLMAYATSNLTLEWVVRRFGDLGDPSPVEFTIDVSRADCEPVHEPGYIEWGERVIGSPYWLAIADMDNPILPGRLTPDCTRENCPEWIAHRGEPGFEIKARESWDLLMAERFEGKFKNPPAYRGPALPVHYASGKYED